MPYSASQSVNDVDDVDKFLSILYTASVIRYVEFVLLYDVINCYS